MDYQSKGHHTKVEGGEPGEKNHESGCGVYLALAWRGGVYLALVWGAVLEASRG